MKIFSKEDDNCLHCGKNKKNYCEKCYQELVAKNTRLQIQSDEYVSKEQLRKIINECSEFGAYVKIKDLLEE